MSPRENIFQSVFDAVYILDRHWRFTYLNPQAEKLVLRTSQELLGKEVWKEFPEAKDSPIFTNYNLALEQQTPVSFEEYYPPLKTWFDITAYPSEDGLTVYFRDITRRKAAEQALQQQLRLANLIAEVSQALIQGADLQAMLQYCTEALVKHLKVAFARIWTFNQSENMLELQASAGEYTHLDGPHGRVPLGSFKIGRIAQEHQPHLSNAVIGDAQVSNQEWAKRENMVAFAGYPLLLEDRLVGVLALFSHEPISDNTFQALDTLVKQIALGIERKQTEISLREQRENYAVTLASIGDAVIATDNQGRVTYLNAVAEELTGWPMAEALGQPLTTIFNIVNMTSRLPVENPVSKVLQLGTVVGLANHTVLLAHDGREIPIDDSAAPIKDGSNQIIGVVLVFRDATERLASEAERNQLLFREQQARQHLERLLAQLAEQQGQLKTKNENLKFLSEATVTLASSLDYNLTLRQIAELLVPTLADFCYFDMINDVGQVERVAWQSIDPTQDELFDRLSTFVPSLEQANHPITEVMTSGQPELVAEVTDQWLQEITQSQEHFELARQTGLISYLAVPFGLRGKTFGVISLCYTRASGRHYGEADTELALELTQRASIAIDNARLYHAAQKALKERETFLSVAAHELKTPLTGLKGFTQVLNRQLERDERQALDPVRVKRTLGIINKQSDKLTYLIDQLLDVSRIESGKLQLDLRETEVVSLVKEVVEQTQGRTTRHTLTFNSPEESLIARLDPVRYEQVVSNLVDNAIKYSPEGGAVELNLTRSEGAPAHFSFSVTDQGLGIPVERRSHVFERFYQAHETTLISGMGLGLYICREIIQLHGGEIRVEFPDEGGTRFIVTIPLES